ncbi:MAG: hypothetical protein KGI79_01840 [Patescibacteria group bacterium]|nr:hypothetical protein [Patescibacteria group bacterium]MDE2116593.1 hypothetical protein [Patescibacteria group bacterium]
MRNSTKKWLSLALAALVIGGGLYYFSVEGAATPVVSYKTPQESRDIYVRFVMEAYDTIRQDFWASTTDAAMADYFQSSLQKALNTPVVPVLSTDDRAGTAAMLEDAFGQATSSAAEKQLALNTLIVALYDLPPVGHGELLSAKQETSFRQNVSNVNPTKDLYQTLGLADGASSTAVDEAYAAEARALAASTTADAKAALAQAAYAKRVLDDPNTKNLYDTAKVEPTISTRIIGHTLYIGMSKIAPTTILEFGDAVLAASTTPLDSMIIDLRGNLGGALDFATEFLGLFIGPNQYAYDLYHQGEYDPQRTDEPLFPELGRYKEIAILTDGMTQSTAELTASEMKRFKLATLIGQTTRGWGTVENTFPLSTAIDPTESYSMLLVHSLTLGTDNQPIQDNGVSPDVSVSDSRWKSELLKHFSSPGMVTAIEQALSAPPIAP